MTTTAANGAGPKSAVPVYILGLIAAATVGAAVTWFAAEICLPKGLGLAHITGIAGVAATVASAFVWAVVLQTGNAVRRKADGGLLAIVMLFATAGAVFATLLVESQVYKAQQRQVDLLSAALYAAALPDIAAYDKTLDDIHASSATSVRRLYYGFSAPQTLATLQSAREAGAKEAAAVTAKVAKARGRLAALPITGRHKAAALRHFDAEFSHDGGGLKQLLSWQTYRIAVMEDEIRFLQGKRWSVQTAFMTFADSADAAEWQNKDRLRGQAEAHLRELEEFINKNARPPEEE